MRGIAKRTVVGVMRCDNERAPAGNQQPVKLFHRANHIDNMFDHVNRANLAKGVVAERIEIAIKICNYVCPRMNVAIDPDRARIFVDTAAYIENRRHCSIVSTESSAQIKAQSEVIQRTWEWLVSDQTIAVTSQTDVCICQQLR